MTYTMLIRENHPEIGLINKCKHNLYAEVTTAMVSENPSVIIQYEQALVRESERFSVEFSTHLLKGQKQNLKLLELLEK